MRIAIIGAGLAGVAAGRGLVEAGCEVHMFDKGRGPGGRLSSRRVAYKGAEVVFDHGAPAFSVSHAAFLDQVVRWQADGLVAPWLGPHYTVPEIGAKFEPNRTPYFVAQPKMNALIKGLMPNLSIDWGRRVTSLTWQDELWQLHFEGGGREVDFERVILALPYEQARDLYAASAGLQSMQALPVLSALPCWSAMFVTGDGIDPEWSSLSVDSGAISFVSAENTKPGRSGPPRYVVQASAAWSRTHLEQAPETIMAHLEAALSELTDFGPIDFRQVHRWRYARMSHAANLAAIWQADTALGFCGDWLLPNDGVEAAWLSGTEMAKQIVMAA